MSRQTHALRRRRRFMPAPLVAAVMVFLVGSVLPATPSQRPGGVRAVTATAAGVTPATPPTSVMKMREPAPASLTSPTPGRPFAATAVVLPTLPKSGPGSVPDVLLAAYRQAVAGAPPGCHLPVSLMAAIGQVESGSLAGRSLDAAHRAVPPVLGPVLDGVNTAAIRDTDGGRLDGNPRWDRAVGPMQFIPGTWAVAGVDGDGDGRAHPQNVYDATAAAARYLCAGGRDLGLGPDLRSAILAYNHSTPYLAAVLAWQQQFSTSGIRTVAAVITKTTTGKPTPAKPTPAKPPTLGVPAAATIPKTIPTPTATSAPTSQVVVHTAAKLVFTTAPGPTATSGTALFTQPVVTIQDDAGNTITTDTSAVTLTLTTPAGASLTCTANPIAATAGVAIFSGCAIDKAGTYTLTATDGSLTTATSSIATITARLQDSCRPTTGSFTVRGARPGAHRKPLEARAACRGPGSDVRTPHR